MKTYTCACGWTTSSETLDELLEKIIIHGKNNHPELAIDEEKICKYIETSNE